MFNPFKKFLSSSAPQPAFAGAGISEPVSLVPSKFGGFTDPALEPKPGLGARILKGLPGFAAQAATVIGAKTLTTALLSSVSPIALAPIVTGAAAIGVGLGVNQSFKYARERMEAASKEQGRDITLKTLWQEASLGGIKREAAAYAQEVTSKSFWKKAAHNGKWSMALGATLGVADHTEIGHEAFQLAKEKAAAGISASGKMAKSAIQYAGENTQKVFNYASLAKAKIQNGMANVAWKNPFQRFAEMASGKAHADLAYKAEAPVQVAAASVEAAPAEAPAPVHQPYVPLTPMEKVHYIAELKGSNPALDKMIARAEGGNMQAVKDLAVGLYNGKLGLPVDKGLAVQLLKVAADGGNTQAIRDLASLAKEAAGHVAKAAVANATPETLVPAGVGDDSRAAAANFIKAAVSTPAADVPAAPQVQAPAPVPEYKVDPVAETKAKAFAYVQNAGPISADPLQQFAHDSALNKAPSRLADEAARCVMGVGDASKRAIRTLCSMFSSVVTPNDHVLVQSADQSLNATYSPESDQNTEEFTAKSRRHFRDTDFMPAFGAQLR